MNLLVKLLSIPLETLSVQVLLMDNFPTIMNYMKFSNKRTVALKICKAVISKGGNLNNLNTVDQLLDFIQPLLVDDDTGKEESYEFEEGQEIVARLVNLVYHKTS